VRRRFLSSSQASKKRLNVRERYTASVSMAMSAWGQSRRIDGPRVTSGLPQLADIVRVGRHVSNVPTAGIRRDGATEAYRHLFYGLEDIRRDQNDGVFAVVAVPMHGRSRFSRRVTGVESFRAAIVANDGVGALKEINHGRTILVAMEADITAWFYGEHA